MSKKTRGLTGIKASAVAAAAAVVSLTWLNPAFAQGRPLPPGPSPAQGLLSNFPGLTEVQRAPAITIENICPFLIPAGQSGGSVGEGQLKASCDTMVGNNTSSQIPLSLQSAASEEMQVKGRIATEAGPRNPVYGRLLALRGGGRGLLLAGSSLRIDGHQFAGARMLPIGATGGGAAADSFGGRLGGFVNAFYNTGDRDPTSRENGFDFDDYGLTAGVDYRFTNEFVGGAALTYSRTDADIDRAFGNVKSDNLGFSLYGSYATGSWYVDGHAGYSMLDFDTRRNIAVPAPIGFNTAATGTTDGDQFTANIGAGYDWNRQNLTVTPYFRVDYLRLKTDAFTESEPVAGLGLSIGERTTRSLQTALGVRVRTPISTQHGVFTPYGGVEWNHEYDNDSRGLVAKFVNDPFNQFFVIPSDEPDRNFFTLSFGVSGVFQRGISAFINFDTVLGLARTSVYGVTVGVRGEF